MLFLKLDKLFCCLLVVSILNACSHVQTPRDANSNVDELTESIRSLSTAISLDEASQTSRMLITTATQLANEYDMTSPALFHNVLVNTGFRKRGLCCHWAEDLHAKLRELQIDSLRFDWLVARLGNELREHNTVVIYAADTAWSKGIVFDPWRNAGVPYWTKVTADKYPWKPHPLSGRWDILQCK